MIAGNSYGIFKGYYSVFTSMQIYVCLPKEAVIWESAASLLLQCIPSQGFCRGLIRATLHMVNREFQALANDFEILGLLPPGSEKQKVVPALSSVFERALAGGVSNMSFSTLSRELGRTM